MRRKRNLPIFSINGFLGLCNAYDSLAAKTNKHGNRDTVWQSLQEGGDHEWERSSAAKKDLFLDLDLNQQAVMLPATSIC
jgi:hypothetical protein